MSKLTVIGGGSWGVALSQLLIDNGHDVIIYDNNEQVVDSINNEHRALVLDGVILPSTLKATLNLGRAVNYGDYIVIAVPTKVIRETLKNIDSHLKTEKIFINGSKGIEPGTFKRVSQIVKEEISSNLFGGFVAISGPAHAEEVVKRMVTSVVSASDNAKICKDVQNIFSNKEYFRVYTSMDIIGVEMGASLKNIIALASGILAGLGYGDNARSALITRGLVEIVRLSVAVGADERTLLGLAGVGDLIVTCTSKHSRNFQAGYKIGSGSNLEETLDSMTMVVEGARSCIAAYELAKEFDIEIPLIESTYKIIYNRQSPIKSIGELMGRDLKAE